MGVYGESIRIADPFFGRLDDDETILRQAIVMVLGTKKGTLPSSPEYGRSLHEYILAGLTDEDLAIIPEEVRQGLKEDERIKEVAATATKMTLANGALALRLALTITPAHGPTFSLTLAISDLTVDDVTKAA